MVVYIGYGVNTANEVIINKLRCFCDPRIIKFGSLPYTYQIKKYDYKFEGSGKI